jgi:multiple sugar transport system substrate-binding protein
VLQATGRSEYTPRNAVQQQAPGLLRGGPAAEVPRYQWQWSFGKETHMHPSAKTFTRAALVQRATLLAAGVGSALWLGGCGLSTAERAAPAAGQDPTKLRASLSLWDRSEPTYGDFFKAWLPPFKAKYPHLEVEYVAHGEGNWEKLVTAIAGGTPPDVVITNSWRPRYHAEQKQSMSLDPFIKAARFDAQDFLQGIYKAMNWGGQQYAVPQYVNTNLLYYNRDLFQRVGVPVPKDDWTHDQFLDAARRLTRGGPPVAETWGVQTGWSGVFVRTASLLWGHGAQFTDPKDPNVFTWTAPENVTAFQWVHEIPWKLHYGPVSDADRGGVAEADAFFSVGKVVMYLEGAHQLVTWKTRAQVDWDVAALPKGPGGRGERGAVDGYIIPVGVKSPDASWALLEGITSGEANRLRSDIAGLPPARKSQLDHWAQSIPGKNIKSGLPTDNVRPDPSALLPKAAELSAALGPIWTALFTRNEIGVMDALKQAREATAGILGPSGVR